MPPWQAAVRASERVELLPSAEIANEGVCVFISEKKGSFIQLEDGVVGIMSSQAPARTAPQIIGTAAFMRGIISQGCWPDVCDMVWQQRGRPGALVICPNTSSCPKSPAT